MAAAADFFDEPEFEHSPNTRLRVRYQSEEWEVAAARFGRDATVHLSRDSVRSATVHLELRNAVFAGTELPAAFKASISRRGGIWWIQFEVAGTSLTEARLDAWMRGAAVELSPLKAGQELVDMEGTRLRVGTGGARITCTREIAPQITAIDQPLVFEDPTLQFTARRVVFSTADTPPAGIDRLVGNRARNCFTLIRAEGMVAARNTQALGRTAAGQEIHCRFRELAAELVTFDDRGDKAGYGMVRGAGALLVRESGARQITVQADHLCLLAPLGSETTRVALAAQLAARQFAIERDNVAIMLRHRAGCGVRAVFGSSAIHGLSVTGELVEAHVPLPGASAACVEFRDQPVRVTFGEDQPPEAPGPEAAALGDFCPMEDGAIEPDTAHLVIGRRVTFSGPMDKGRLRLQRNRDRLDLQFGFPRHTIEVNRTGTHLRSTAAEQRMIAHFHPQHVYEEAREARDVANPPPGSPRNIRDVSGTLGAGLSRTRLSGLSRIAFEIKDTPPDDPLTFEYLTDWAKLLPAVCPRALGRNPSLEQQFKAAGIAQPATIGRAEARKSIADSLMPPSAEQTALEVVSGLLLSPDSTARFVRPPPGPKEDDITPWSVRLELGEQSAVRAVYAEGMTERLFPPGTPPKGPPFASSLTVENRAEIAASMSAYAIPALRRLKKSATGVDDDRNGQVFRPKDKYYLSERTDSEQNLQEGFFHPRGFAEADIELAAFGASVALRWEAEPPAAVQPDDFFRTLNVESYTHRTVEKWDAVVQVIEKGFLYPLGHRVALVRVAERQFHPRHGNNQDVDPTGYLILRQFIICRKPLKAYPALNQPFASRDFPAQSIELVTTTTEDLLIPSEPLSDGAGGKLPRGVAFWPQRANGDDIMFQFRVNGGAQLVSAPLLYVNNEAAHYPASVEKIIDWYHRARESRRTAAHGGADRQYADPREPGETSYPTHGWLLAGRGRAVSPELKDDPLAAYLFDALMEGADQPPFYPWVEKAMITVATVDRLLGHVQGPITVSYYDGYRQNAFDRSGNPSEIYLDVLGPRIELDFSGQGSTSGGIAKPNATLAAISREVGLVGGKLLANAVPGARGATSDLRFDTEQAKGGVLDPAVFFGDAKLLGLIALKDVLQLSGILGAPKLTEIYQYGAGAAESLRQKLMQAAAAMAGAITSALDTAQQRVTQTYPGATLADLYPDLLARLTAVGDSATLLGRAAPPLSDAQFREEATKLVTQGRMLLQALEQVAANPTPAIIADVLTQVRAFRDSLKGGLEKFLRDAAQQVKEAAAQRLLGFAAEISQDTGFESIFGEIDEALDQDYWRIFPDIAPRLPDPARLRAAFTNFISNPANFAGRIEATAFYQTYGKSFVRAFAAVHAMFAEGHLVLPWSRARVRDAIITAAGLSLDRHPKVRAALDGIIGRVEAELTAGSVTEIPTKIRNAARAASDAVGGLPDLLDQAREEAETAYRNALLDLQEKYAEAAKDAAVEKLLPAFEARHAEARRLWEELKASATSLRAGLAGTRARVEAEVAAELLATNGQLRDALSAAVAAPQELGGKVQALVDAVLDHLEESLRFAVLAAEERVAPDVLKAARALLVDIVPPADQMVAKLKAVMAAMENLKLPAELPETVRGRLFGEIAMLQQHLTRAVRWLIEFEKIRFALGRSSGEWTSTSARVTLLGRATELRRRTVEELRGVLVGLASLGTLAGSSAGARKASAGATRDAARARRDNARAAMLEGVQGAANDAVKAVAPILQLVTAIGAAGGTMPADVTQRWNAAEALVKAFITATGSPTAKAAATEALRVLKAEAVAAAASWPGTPSIQADWSAICHGFSQLTSEAERRLAGLVLEALRLPVKAAMHLGGGTLELVMVTGGVLAAVYGEASAVLARAMTALTPAGSPAGTLAAAVAKPGLTALKKAADIVKKETDLLNDILGYAGAAKAALPAPDAATAAAATGFAKSTNVTRLVDALTKLRNQWRDEGIGLVVAGNQVVRLLEQLVHGQMSAIFDVRALRDSLKGLVEQLIPHEVILTYDWDTALGSFPSDDPIFEIETAVPPPQGKGYVLPRTKDGRAADLVLGSEVRLNLLTGERSASARGEIRPFNVRLLGSAVDLLTIKFKGATFEAKPGSRPHLHAEVDRVVLGSALEFIQALQQLMSPGEGNGPYIAPNFFPPGIEAGYRYSSELIPVGNLQFINVAIGVSMLLPFDNREAEFRFNFATREKPFLIAAPPYGGGGFVSLTANAKGISVFEISFEFGAVVAIRFGPLNANGRVTAGIYLFTGPGTRVLEGFVHAVGEGHIACFGVSVCIEVKVRQENGGAMRGSSRYSMSFKVGFCRFSYSFTAGYTIQGGTNKGGPPPPATDRNNRPLRRPGAVIAAAHRVKSIAASGAHGPCIISNVPRKAKNWRAYRRLVAIDPK